MEDDSIKNRRPAVAGTFYPAGRQSLKNTVEAHFQASLSGQNLENIRAVIAPHAGYVYSGTVAASAFNQLNPDYNYENVFLIGSSHQVSFNGAAVFSSGNFETPMGTAVVNISLAREIISSNSEIFKEDPQAHESEHSLEVQVPFLQYLYRQNLRLVPIIIATQQKSTVKKIAKALSPYFNENNLFVISTDFSHYPDYEDAIMVDDKTADAIIKNSPEIFLSVLEENSGKNIPNLATSICGWTSVLTLLYITRDLPGVKFHRILYRNSGDAAYGNKGRVVGYQAMAVTADPGESGHDATGREFLSVSEKATLLELARSTIAEFLETGKIPDATSFPTLTEKLLQPAGAFVTLKKDGNLRGCIGQFSTDRALYQMVQEMAISAATRDYRFPPLKMDELQHVHIEISLLTLMQPVKSINEIIPGKHGIYIKKGNHSGTYLPQVANQTGWDATELVSHCARDKAGIGYDGWHDAQLFVYEAYVFGE